MSYIAWVIEIISCSLHSAIAEVTINDVGLAVPGDNVTLTCSATGDTPFIYQWTIEGNSTDILNTNTSVGILTLTNIVESDFGTYTCEVINALGDDAESIVLEQASKFFFAHLASHFNISLYS